MYFPCITPRSHIDSFSCQNPRIIFEQHCRKNGYHAFRSSSSRFVAFRAVVDPVSPASGECFVCALDYKANDRVVEPAFDSIFRKLFGPSGGPVCEKRFAKLFSTSWSSWWPVYASVWCVFWRWKSGVCACTRVISIFLLGWLDGFHSSKPSQESVDCVVLRFYACGRVKKTEDDWPCGRTVRAKERQSISRASREWKTSGRRSRVPLLTRVARLFSKWCKWNWGSKFIVKTKFWTVRTATHMNNVFIRWGVNFTDLLSFQ